jgi:TonB family protein
MLPGVLQPVAQTTVQDTTPENPVATPFTKPPELKDRRGAARIVEWHYPEQLKHAGIAGTVVVWVFVDTEGKVRNTQVHESSGNDVLDNAALSAVREFEFIPARNDDEVVPVWVAIPIVFTVRRDPLRAALGFVILLAPVLILTNAGLWYAFGRALKKSDPAAWEQLAAFPTSEVVRLKFLWGGTYSALASRRLNRIARVLKITSLMAYVVVSLVLLLGLSHVVIARGGGEVSSWGDYLADYWWVIVLAAAAYYVVATRRRRCPGCGSRVRAFDVSCPHCEATIAGPHSDRQQLQTKVLLVVTLLGLLLFFLLYVV